MIQLLGEVAALQQAVAAQQAEIARLKGLKGPPSSAQRHGAGHLARGVKASRRQRRRGRVRPRVSIEAQVLRVTAPAGPRFKRYVCDLVQGLVLSVRAVRYGANAGRSSSPLPDGTCGHFGPDLRRFVLMLYLQGQSTLPRVTALLQLLGVPIF